MAYKPYDKRQSFMGKLKSVVPRWISKFIPWEKNSNDNSNEDGSAQSSINSEFKCPPPPQSAPNHEPITAPSFSLPSASNSEINFDTHRLPFPSYEQGSTNFDRERSATDDNRLEDDDGESVSTSGCSSMLPHFDRHSEYQPEVLPIDDSALERLRDQLQSDAPNLAQSCKKSTKTSLFKNMSKREPSVKSPPSKRLHLDSESYLYSIDSPDKQNEKESIWDKANESFDTPRPQKSSSNRRPSFQLHSFGSPLFADINKRSILSDNSNESIFYPGKTTFGGASTQRKFQMKSTLSFKNRNSFKPYVKTKSNESNDLGLVSSSAKRILRTLDGMSTPLSDAYKIPSSHRDTNSILSFTPSDIRKKKLGLSSSLNKSTTKGPPTRRMLPCNEVSIPSTSLKTTSHTSLSVDDGGNKAFASDNFKSDVASAGGKMKNKTRESLHYSSKHLQNTENDILQTPVLPAVSLDVKAMPKIDFGSLDSNYHSTPIPPAAAFKKTVTLDISTSNTSLIKQSNLINNDSERFNFSTPVLKGPPVSLISSKLSTSFTFTAPKMVDKNTSDDANKISSSNLSSISDGEYNNKAQFNFKMPDSSVMLKKKPNFLEDLEKKPELKEGSVSDFFKSVAKPDVNGNDRKQLDGFDSKFKRPAGSWECDECMVINKANAVACIACMTSKPSAKSSTGKEPAITFGDQPKSKNTFWECPTCLIQNKNCVDKCVACETPNPTKAISNTKLLSAFSHVNKWECDSCMILNDNNINKCVACETPKTSVKENTSVISVSNSWECDTCLIFNKADVDKCAACESPKPFKDSKSKKPVASTSWECNTCMVMNKTEATKCIACETPKVSGNVAPPIIPSTWECDTCLIINKAGVSKCIACETPKAGNNISSGSFTFGASSSYKFGKQDDSVSKSSSSTEPGFTFKAADSKTDGSEKSGGFVFGGSIIKKSEPLSSQSGGFVFNSSSSQADGVGSKGFTFGSASSNKDVPSTKLSEGFKIGDTKSKTDDSSKAVSSFTFTGSGSEKSASSKPFGRITFGNTDTSGNTSNKLSDSIASKIFEPNDSSGKLTEQKPLEALSKTSDLADGSFKTVDRQPVDVNKSTSSSFLPIVSSSEGVKNTSTTISPTKGFSFGNNLSQPKSSELFTFGKSAASGEKKVDSSKSSIESFNFTSNVSKPANVPSFGSSTSIEKPKSIVDGGKGNAGTLPVFGNPNTKAENLQVGSQSKLPAFDGSSALGIKSLPQSAGSPALKDSNDSPFTKSLFSGSSESKTSIALGSSSSSSLTTSSFNFGTPTSSQFVFGNAKTSTDAKFSSVNPLTKNSQMQSSNPGTFTFGSNAASAPSTATSASSTFTFGTTPNSTSVPTSSTATPGLFVFGNSITAEKPSTSLNTPGTFSFGASTKPVPSAVSTTTMSTPSTFSFGGNKTENSFFKSQETPKKLFESATQATSTPTFGSSINSSTASAFGTNSTFSVGGSLATSASQALPFGSAVSNTTVPAFGTTTAPVLSFGASPAVTSSSNASNPSAFSFGSQPSNNASTTTTSAFTFGSQQTANQSNSSGFNFGGTNSTPAPAFGTPTGGNPIFRFGAPESQSSQPVFGSAPQPSATPSGGFNFNSPSVNNANFQPQPSQPFQFGASAGDNPFRVPANQQNSGARKFKRAQRRIKK